MIVQLREVIFKIITNNYYGAVNGVKCVMNGVKWVVNSI